MSATPVQAGVIAEFIGHPRETAWHRAYVDARNSVLDARPVGIYDIADVPPELMGDGDARVAILVRVVRSAEVQRKAVRDLIDGDCKRQVEDGQLTLGLSPFGSRADDAAEVLFQQVGQPPGGLTRWIEGTSNLDELRSVLADWLLLVVDRRLPPSGDAGSALADTEAVLAEEMPSTDASTDATGPRRLRGIP